MQLIVRKEATPTRLERSAGALHILSDYIREPYFKRLLNSLAGSQFHVNFKTLAVLSEQQGEGKTFFVCSLALAYSQYLNGRVLIVDTTKQSKDKMLFMECLISESQNLIGKNGDKQPKGDSRSRIDFLTTRSASGANYDWSDFQLASYVDRHKNDYDLVLIDTCALTSVDRYATDPMIIARAADASILVTSKRTLRKDKIAGIQRELRTAEVRLLGTVHNVGAA